MKEQPQQRRGTDHPEGAWRWTKGPSWWRDMPALYKALVVIALAFMAGMTTWATLSVQFGLPAIVRSQGQRLNRIEGWQDSIRYVVPMVEADHVLIQQHKAQLDSVTTVLGGVWCVMRADAHGLDPLRECFVPRPNGPRRE
jgi:hypothetical protein